MRSGSPDSVRAVSTQESRKFLRLQLKSLAAQALLPGQDSAERTAKRHELRTQCLAILDGVQADMKKNKGGWWIFPNPLTIAEWIF
jgi:hypothetical protein